MLQGIGNKQVVNIEILYVSGQILGKIGRQGRLSRSSLTTLNKYLPIILYQFLCCAWVIYYFYSKKVKTLFEPTVDRRHYQDIVVHASFSEGTK